MMFRRRTATIVGPETSLKGDLVCGDDDACIAGRLEGSIVSEARVVVVAGGQVRGDVLADVVVVAGVVRGSVIARKRCTCRPPGGSRVTPCTGRSRSTAVVSSKEGRAR